MIRVIIALLAVFMLAAAPDKSTTSAVAVTAFNTAFATVSADASTTEGGSSVWRVGTVTARLSKDGTKEIDAPGRGLRVYLVKGKASFYCGKLADLQALAAERAP